MAYNMNALILHCTVPFPKTGLPCPVCNRKQRNTSSFKTHARKVHRTLDAQTPTTCSVCSRKLATFQVASAHYGRAHQAPKSPSKTSASEIPLTPRTEDMLNEVLNRSPPLTCRTLPRHNLSPRSPTHQKLRTSDHLHRAPRQLHTSQPHRPGLRHQTSLPPCHSAKQRSAQTWRGRSTL